MTTRRTPEGWQRIKGILDEALDLPEKERAAFIAGRCGGDEEMQREIESLAAAADGWTFVDQAAEGRAVPAAEVRWPSPAVGDRVGAYELLSELGQGGMGMVYLARRADDQFQKKVAIKLIRPGMASEFVAPAVPERAADRRPRSSTPTSRGSSTAARRRTARPTSCSSTSKGSRSSSTAIAARCRCRNGCASFSRSAGPGHLRPPEPGGASGHQAEKHPGDARRRAEAAGFRDREDAPAARALPTPPAETATLFRMMTPDYASPEQIRGKRITTASDVYALGVVLYELLAGRSRIA